MSEMKMKQAFPESVGFSSAPRQMYPNQMVRLHQLVPQPLPEVERRSKVRLTVWSWVALGYAILNIAAVPIALFGLLAVFLGGVLLSVALGQGGFLIGLLLGLLFLLWIVSIPAAGIVGMVSAIRGRRLHRLIAPYGHNAKMSIIVGWIGCGLAFGIFLSLVGYIAYILAGTR